MTQTQRLSSSTPSTSRWFAAHVRSNQERSVASVLEAKNLQTYVPVYRETRRWSDRIKQIERPLFPGYVFCRVEPDRRGPIQMTPGVVRIVGAGSTPLAIDDAEMDTLRKVAASTSARPHPFLAVGDAVQVRGGPFDGVTGVLERIKGSCKLVVGISLLQRSVAVEFDESWVGLEKRLASRWDSC